INKCRNYAHDHHRVGASQTRARKRCNRNTGGFDFVREESLKHCRAGAYGDDFWVAAHLLEELSVFDDPDWTVGRAKARPCQPESLLSENPGAEAGRYRQNKHYDRELFCHSCVLLLARAKTIILALRRSR